MLPQDRLSSTPLIDPLVPNNYLGTFLRAIEYGGVALNDASQGLLVKLWTLEYKPSTGNLEISAPGVSVTVLFNRPNISEVSLAFDRNMNVAVAFVQAGQAKLYYYDSVLLSMTFLETALGTATSPRVVHDDKRTLQSGNSDVILGYVRDGILYYRQQRDRYLVERQLAIGVTGPLAYMAMAPNLRVHFAFLQDVPPYLPPEPPSDPLAAGIIAKTTEWWPLDGPGTLNVPLNTYISAAGINVQAGVETKNDLRKFVAATTPFATSTDPRGLAGLAILNPRARVFGADQINLTVTNSIQWEYWFWVKFTNVSGIQFPVSHWPATSAPNLHWISALNAGVYVAQTGGSSYTAASTPSGTIVAGAWTFINGWRDAAGKINLRINNTGTTYQSATASSGTINASPGLFVGAASASSDFPFAGSIWELGWARGTNMTDIERTYLYNSGFGRKYAEVLFDS